MGIEKKYFKNKPVCKATFTLCKEAAGDATSVYVVGDFNNWDSLATPMKKQKSGAFKATVDIETGREHQYRFLVDGTRWVNDWNADKYVPSPFGDCENCVVVA